MHGLTSCKSILLMLALLLGIPCTGDPNPALEMHAALEPLFRAAHIERVELEFPFTRKVERRPVGGSCIGPLGQSLGRQDNRRDKEEPKAEE